jgi:protein SMG8
MEHSSGVRYISACNCGRKQGPREDPFTMRAANYDFYHLLGEECGCNNLESIRFPVFQPSTQDYRYEPNFSSFVNDKIYHMLFTILLFFSRIFLYHISVKMEANVSIVG